MQIIATIEFGEKFNGGMVAEGDLDDGVGALASSSRQDQGQLAAGHVNKLPNSNTPLKNHQNGSNFPQVFQGRFLSLTLPSQIRKENYLFNRA